MSVTRVENRLAVMCVSSQWVHVGSEALSYLSQLTLYSTVSTSSHQCVSLSCRERDGLCNELEKMKRLLSEQEVRESLVKEDLHKSTKQV